MPSTGNIVRAGGDIAVIAAFTALSLWPVLRGPEQVDAGGEGRKLAAPPPTPQSLEQLFAWPGSYEKWFDDHFGGRSTLLALNTGVTLGLFGVSPVDQVVCGRQGWLYYTRDGIFADRRGEERIDEAALARWQSALEGRHTWLADRGIPYAFVIAPNKVTIHPQFLPWRHRERPDVPTRVDQIVAHMQARSRFAITDCRPALAAAARDEQVYHATDSHWNDLGAHCGYRTVLAAFAAQGLSLEPLAREAFELQRAPRRGDLARLLPAANIADEMAWSLVPKTPRRARRVELPPEWQQVPPAWGVWEPPVLYECEGATGSLLAIGDSFQWQWMPFLAEHFRRVVFVSAVITDVAVLQAMVEVVKPTAVLEERVERNTKWTPSPHPTTMQPR